MRPRSGPTKRRGVWARCDEGSIRPKTTSLHASRYYRVALGLVLNMRKLWVTGLLHSRGGEPKAKARKITESRRAPTRLDNMMTHSQNRFLRGVYTPKSASSENRKAAPLARANCGETKAESAAPRSMAKTTARRPSFSCVKSLKVKASPAKYTPAGAISPKPTGTTPKAAIAQLATKMVAT